MTNIAFIELRFRSPPCGSLSEMPTWLFSGPYIIKVILKLYLNVPSYNIISVIYLSLLYVCNIFILNSLNSFFLNIKTK